MSPLEALRELQSRSLVTMEDGEPCEAELLPPMSDADIDRLEESIGRPIPADVRELMRASAGVCVDGEELAWHGGLVCQYVGDVFPSSLTVMEDGLGNTWEVDIDPVTGGWGAVYFLSHDPPAVVHQAPTLADFISQFAEDCCRPERDGALCSVSARLVNKVWDTGGKVMDAGPLSESTDLVLKRAGAGVEEGVVCDLRNAKLGDGFNWGRYGPRTIISRPGPEPVWIVRPPAGGKKRWRLWA